MTSVQTARNVKPLRLSITSGPTEYEIVSVKDLPDFSEENLCVVLVKEGSGQHYADTVLAEGKPAAGEKWVFTESDSFPTARKSA